MLMCEKISTTFWRSSVLMRILAIFCLFCFVNAESTKNPPRFYLPGEENENVDGQNNESSSMRQGVILTDLVDCSVHNGQLLCKDKRKCLNLSDTCDDKCDCFDCSDESDLCWEYNEILCRSCDHLCFPSPHGSMCLSNNNTLKFSQLGLQECDPNTVCNQKCVMYKGIERCSCRENYRGKPGTKGQECISDVSYENLLLYSTNNEIKLFNFTANETFVIRKGVECLGLAAAGDYFYYGTSENHTGYVHKMSVVTGETDLIIDTCTDSSMIYSIDVDWITGNIYFSTDACIGVCSKDEEFCTKVKTLSVIDMCHLALAPRSGMPGMGKFASGCSKSAPQKMQEANQNVQSRLNEPFQTDPNLISDALLFNSMGSIYHSYEHSRIMKASMDGSNEETLYAAYNTGSLSHPKSLTVDELSEKVFWIDTDLGEIHSIKFDGKNWKIVFASPQIHIFTISKFESNLFWTEENKNTIGTNFQNDTKFIVDENATSVKYLYAFNPVLQRNNFSQISNPCTNSGCKGLCLLRPSSTKGVLNFRCVCDNMTSSSRKQWCINPYVPVGWQFEKESEEETQPPQLEICPPQSAESPANQSEGRCECLKVISLVIIICGFLIVLASVSIYFVFRRRYRISISRVVNRNNNEDTEKYMSLTEYRDAELKQV